MDIRQAVVINRPDRPERLASFLTRWRAMELTIPLDVFPAIEGGAAGCMMSHRQVWAEATGPTLVLEDDAVFRPGFPAPTEPPRGWDVVWFGGDHAWLPRPAKKGWVRPVVMLRTHAYAVRDPSRLLQAFEAARPWRMDPFVAQLPLRQYCVAPHTAGQAAGPSDTGGPALKRDTFWDER